MHSLGAGKFFSLSEPLSVKIMLTILTAGAILRICFALWGSWIYYGAVTFTFGDSFSYSEPFLNLLQYGQYTFDFSRPDASLFRGPVYPFFWGAHYLLFGQNFVYQSVALSQAILDTVSGFLVYLIIMRLTGDRMAAMLGLTLFVFNPIQLVYIPITGTEVFSTTLSLLAIYAITTASTKWGWFGVGILCGLLVMTRQYLGLFLPIALLYPICPPLTEST